MKASQFYIITLIGFIGLIMSITLVIIGQSNRTLQAQVEEQQKVIAQGNNSQQVLQNLLRDLAQASTRDEKVKELLARHGYTVSSNPPAPAQ